MGLSRLMILVGDEESTRTHIRGGELAFGTHSQLRHGRIFSYHGGSLWGPAGGETGTAGTLTCSKRFPSGVMAKNRQITGNDLQPINQGKSK